MRRAFATLLVCVGSFACAAAPSPEGRWEGVIQIPGRELPLVVDLAPDGAGAGAWAGSIIIAGLGLKGAPLSNVVVADGVVAFDLGNALSSPTNGPAAFSAHLVAGDSMAGEFHQGGNVAKVSLRKAGSAEVESSPRSTPVRRDIEDQWSGEFELGGYPRQVTITFENHAGGAATAKFVVVGKRTTELPVDIVIEEGNFVRIESLADRVTFEGNFVSEKSEIRGTIDLGPFERPLILRRVAERVS